jgi:hypothetical protein
MNDMAIYDVPDLVRQDGLLTANRRIEIRRAPVILRNRAKDFPYGTTGISPHSFMQRKRGN